MKDKQQKTFVNELFNALNTAQKAMDHRSRTQCVSIYTNDQFKIDTLVLDLCSRTFTKIDINIKEGTPVSTAQISTARSYKNECQNIAGRWSDAKPFTR